MATTYEKMSVMRDELRTLAIEDTSSEMQPLVTFVQVAAGMGIDVFDWLIPDDPADADSFVDGLLALFHRIRGDDLPPFDLDRYGEASLDDTTSDLEHDGMPSVDLDVDADADGVSSER